MFWYLLSALIVLCFMWRISKKYGTLLNPIGFLGGYYLMIATIAPMVFQSLGLFKNTSTEALRYTSILSTLFFIALGIAFEVRSSPFKKIFETLFRFIRPFELKEQGSGLAYSVLLGQAVLLFILLMVLSGSGSLWLTNPRLAYTNRDSVGAEWSLCQATLFLTFICVIFRKAKDFKSLFGIAACFAGFAWFLGAKGAMLTYFILALFYAHIRIRKVTNRAVVLTGVVVLLTSLVLQLYQGTAQDLLGTLTYFDYFSNSAMLIDRFKDFGFRYGAVTFSNIWLYVPRGLYHAKPYVYAQVIADEFLYPGGAADGFSAGMMPWTQGYCDIGMAGVIIYGFFLGFLAKGAYELFLERKDIQTMMLFGQIGLIYCIELFAPAPFLMFLVWLMFQMALIRLLSKIKVLPPFRRVRAAGSGV